MQDIIYANPKGVETHMLRTGVLHCRLSPKGLGVEDLEKPLGVGLSGSELAHWMWALQGEVGILASAACCLCFLATKRWAGHFYLTFVCCALCYTGPRQQSSVRTGMGLWNVSRNIPSLLGGWLVPLHPQSGNRAWTGSEGRLLNFQIFPPVSHFLQHFLFLKILHTS